ncbi:crossover junction endodeoxyribonuclease RuvC [Burkholderia ubonensis]|uniref:crossover junction endodeoxyribonuclease RuvC n=1 Tax=Burkholderia ubonensis TaxID=101571 RepID=UPI0012F92617|nr:crossover junction endodeoxyribonuclease RuvC [Burkholderia ubonensis]
MTRPEKQFDTKLIHFKGVKGIERVAKLQNAVGHVLDEFEPEVAFVEAYGLSNRFTLVEMVEVGTVVRLELKHRGIPWFNVPPTTLKQWVAGKGNAKKPDMKRAVEEKWGFTSSSDDVVDAVGLNRFGYAYFAGSLTDKQREATVRGN